MSKVKKNIIIAGLCIIIFMCAIIIFLELKTKVQPPIQKLPLTTQQENQMLKKLDAPAIAHPISNKKAMDILKKLNTETTKHLSIQEKEALLKSNK